jgi:hypothetical protein
MKTFLNSRAAQVGMIAAVGAGVIWYVKKEAAKVARAVDPTSKDNVAYTGVNAVGEVLSGKPGFDLGHWIYDITHSEPE